MLLAAGWTPLNTVTAKGCVKPSIMPRFKYKFIMGGVKIISGSLLLYLSLEPLAGKWRSGG